MFSMEKYSDEVIAGQATYTPFFLNIYDLFVVRFSNRYFWHCPPSKTIELYQKNVSSDHLDIGVGTGYFLQTCQKVRLANSVGIMDLNQNSLNKTKSALEKIGVSNVSVYNANALEPFPFQESNYLSVGLNYLLHCVPGTFDHKLGNIFKSIKAATRPDRKVKVFGSTIIIDAEKHTPLSNAVMRFYHKKGIFHNQFDTCESLASVCNQYSNDVSISVIGAVAFFEVTIET